MKLTAQEIEDRLVRLKGWQQNGLCISRTYSFENYYQTIAFVNAIAWISHREDHHPDLAVTYNTCRVDYSTHSAGGLTEKDFHCAAQMDALFKP
jgi:4a-hydroxytetrahydrobiopterin dehydratase